MADFLGFGHLLKTEVNPIGKYSENEVYQHITNCQVFLAYNVDETKLLKRRKTFQDSMRFLFHLAENGNAKEVDRFWITKRFFACFNDGNANNASKNMRKLGITVAERILATEKDVGKTAAVLLLIALDGAYNSVLAVSSLKQAICKTCRKLAHMVTSSRLFLTIIWKVYAITRKARTKACLDLLWTAAAHGLTSRSFH